MKEIYEPKFVEQLFDKMSGSYSRVNYITSFGFSARWRKQCVNEIDIKPGHTVIDLLTGMGECWPYILKKADDNSKLIGLDFSGEMVNRAKKRKAKYKNADIQILKENVFENSIRDNEADCIISGFGLKTFNNEQLEGLADEIDRMLKPNGQFSLIDVSVPNNKVLKMFYIFYLKRLIPILGWLFLGNPEAYKMLGIYTEAFENSKNVFRIFENRQFDVELVTYFYGCATGVKGRKRK